MQNVQIAETADIWRAAQYRRTEDLTGWWVGYFSRRSEKMTDADVVAQRALKPHHALALAWATAAMTLAAVTSVSTLVDAEKSPHVVMRPTGPMPAVNIP
jgi:hypothetical protein